MVRNRHRQKRRRLAPRLLLTVVVTSSLLTLLLTTYHLVTDLHHQKTHLNARLEHIGESFLPAIRSSAWLMDEQQLLASLKAIHQLEGIEHVAFFHAEASGDYSLGEAVSKEPLSKSLPVYYTHRGNKHFLGTLQISATTQHITTHIWEKGGLMLLGNGFVILLIALVVLFFFHRLVTQRILTIAEQANEISAGTRESAIQLPSGQRFHDELNDVVVALNTMLLQQHDYHETLQHEVEQQLQASEARFKKIFDDNPDPCWLIDEHTFIECNQAAVDTLGYADSADLKALHPSALSPQYQADGRPSREKADEMINLALQKGIHRFEWLHQKAGGEVFPVEVTLSTFESEGHQMIFCIWRDISERKQAETEREQLQKQLLHAQKLEAIGQLTGGIAHDFNNILASILGYTELMELQDKLDERNRRYVGEIHQAAVRAKNLVTKMLAFARGAEQEEETSTPAAIVTEAVQMLSPTLPSSITMELNIAEPVPAITIAPDALLQIVTNLLINARDAMQGQGFITIHLEGPTPAHGYCSVCGEALRDDYVVLTIADDGEGIPQEVQPRIFDPFFTTKEVGKGSGMGLSMVAGIVRAIGGHTQVESEPGNGTTFRLYFPPATASSEKTTPVTTSQASPPRGDGEHILIVDDEPALTHYLSELLTDHGYRCSAENNSLQALQQITQTPAKFDLLLTDQTMPKLSGTELIAQVRKVRANLPVILATGYSDKINQQDAAMLQIPYLEKPVDAATLLRLLKETLEKSSQNP